MKRKITSYIIILIILAVTYGGAGIVRADPTDSPATVTPSPPMPTPSPTPVVNEIGSIGDLSIKASYSDNAVFESDMAILSKNLNESTDTNNIIEAVRNIEKDKDIFYIFELSLQKNGRDTEVTKQMNIRIEQKDTLEQYTDISVFKIDSSGFAHAVDSRTDNGYILYTASELGRFVLTGVSANNTANPNPTPGNNTTLQSGGVTGIISPKPPEAENNAGDGIVTPGAFVFWLALAIIIGIWIGIGIGYILWGRYKSKKIYKGPKIIGE